MKRMSQPMRILNTELMPMLLASNLLGERLFQPWGDRGGLVGVRASNIQGERRDA